VRPTGLRSPRAIRRSRSRAARRRLEIQNPSGLSIWSTTIANWQIRSDLESTISLSWR